MEPKWEATVTATSPESNPSQIWPFFKDFFNIHKWLPSLSACYGVHGVNGHPGCIRYCAGFSIPSAGENNPAAVSWSKERLISVDDVERVMRYEMVESNIGFHGYLSTVRVAAGAADGGGGSVVEWSVSVDPVKGLEYEELVEKYDVALKIMVQRMENQIHSDSTENSETDWKGKATAELKLILADQAWPYVADFCNLHKFFPDLHTCYQVDGELGKPGLVRYCSSAPPPSSDGSDQTAVKWAKERLVMIDPAARCLSYEILENNLGFKSYTATFRVMEGGDGDGSVIEWSFVGDPVEGLRCEDFESYCESSLKFMAEKIETLCSK